MKIKYHFPCQNITIMLKVYRWNITANRTISLPFGHSMIVSPDGNILKELSKSEDVITASIDPNLPKKLRSIIPSLNSD
mgnify:CR=1 FL=1